ncbi:MAG: S1 RNA-binding domain-containing protein [Anaerolineae bacterium]|nr:S1 RNA-binding domain-containing protein [Anaerolineae bacterium]
MAAWRQVLPDEKEWWMALDEGYWQALLQQGEVAPDVVPPVDPQEVFSFLDTDAGTWGRVEAERENHTEMVADDVWQQAATSLERGDDFTLAIVGANRGGLLVEWNGLQGFIPASHLTEIPRSQDPHQRIQELAHHTGKMVTVRLIEVDPEQGRLVFSERAATSSFCSPDAVFGRLSPGVITNGHVTNLTSFGAFVDLGGVEGLIHVSELSWDRVRHPADVLQPGQGVEVYVLGVNPDEGRIALSLKRLRPNPWIDVESRYYPGQVLQGAITNVVSFGAFVRLEEGIEGLIHVSELAEGNFLHPRNVVHEGDTVRVRVLNIDAGNQRLGLSLRQARAVSTQAEPGRGSTAGGE